MTGAFTLKSPAFAHNGVIPAKYTCDGEDVSPPLAWENIPEGIRFLVLIMDDPDAPRGTWVHWIVFNIPPDTARIEEGKEPEGVSGNNSWLTLGYGGPCPPEGVHRYFFKLYALDTMLDLSEGATKAEVEAAMTGHILAETTLIGLYERS
ncbi:YbhB/YbcL family Raf kinase inhibitor-like protein [Candidatus Wolfebacteria bacterium]|nr:YbhB/YbcL family Raf kinase inhibitor-like protein [Candidatus Wolfebacteria bacterium]